MLASRDGGRTWRLVSNGVADDVLAIKMASSTKGYAVTRFSYLLRTRDGGRYWEAKRLTVTDNVYQHPEGLRTLDALDGQFAVAAGIGGIVFKTEDGGETWQPIGYPTLSGLFDIYDVRFTSRQTGWVVGWDNDLGHYRNIYRTTDGGLTWQLVMPLQAATTYYAVDFVGSSGWIVGPRSYMLRTTDGGNTWRQVNLPYGNVTNLRFVDVGFATEQIGWMIGGQGYVLRSTDGGQTWVRQNSNALEDLVALYVVSPNEAWIAGIQGGIFRTVDGGQTWVREQTGYPGPLTALHGTPDGQLVAGGYEGFLMARRQGNRVIPASVSIPFGSIYSGSTTAVRNSDNNYLILESRTPTQSGDPYVQVMVEGVASARPWGQLTFRFEGKSNASPLTRVRQVLELFNFATSQWEVREERLPDQSDDGVCETFVQNPSSYIQAGTGRMRARIS